MSSRLPRLLAATGLAVTVVTLAAACSQNAGDKSAAPPAAPGSTAQFGDGPASAPATPESTATPGATATPATVTKTSKPAAPLADGRRPGFIKNVGDDSVSMDLVEFLTGDAAVKAWQKKYPDSDQDSPDNDYFIVNDNTKVRELPLAPSVVVKVVGETGPEATETIAVSAVEKHFGSLLKSTLFWFTVKEGQVTKIEQQFLP
jgi:hypothetical protein